MTNFKHTYPRGIKTGIEINGKWKWDKVDWELCDCGFYHSNRVIPDSYWDQWRKPKNKEFHIKKSTGIIFIRGDKEIWITQSYWNRFGFPKGSENESDMSSIDSATREFHEETGMDFEKSLPHKDLTKSKQIRWYDVSKKTLYTFFIVNVPLWFNIYSNPIDDVEITSFGWVPIYKLRKVNFAKSSKEIFTQFMEYRNSSSYDDFVRKRTLRLNDTYERHFGKFEKLKI